MKSRNSYSIFSGGAALFLSVLLIVQPIQANVIHPESSLSVLGDQQRQLLADVRTFANGSKLTIAVDQASVPLVTDKSVAADSSSKLPEMEFVFEASNGEQLKMRVRQRGAKWFSASLDGLFSLRFKVGLDEGTPRVEKQRLVLSNRIIDLGDRSLVREDIMSDLAAVEHQVKLRYSSLLLDEFSEAMTELARQDSPPATSLNSGSNRVTSPLRSRDALHCGSHIVSYLGSFVSLAGCVAIPSCAFWILVHYAAIGGAVAACVGWIRAEVADRDGTGGDGDDGGDGGDAGGSDGSSGG